MRCTNRNCKNVRDICPISKLCPPCDTFMKDYNKRQESQDRQQSARDQVHNQNRNLSSPGALFSSPPPSGPSQPSTHPFRPPTTSAANFPPMSGLGAAPPVTPNNANFHLPPMSGAGAAHAAPPHTAQTARPPAHNAANYPHVNTAGAAGITPAPPPINITNLQKSYNQAKSTAAESPLLLDMFALMLNIHSKQSETESFSSDIKQANTRLDAVEAKIGGVNDVAERLGLAVRQLPLPSQGYTDLDMVRRVLAEIRAPGVDVNRDILKAVRKLPAKPNPNPSHPILGTVLVEMRDEESRASIMKNKHTLQHHPDITIQNIIIKNMKSKEQMFMENLGNCILKKIPGCENSFVTPNGQIREGSTNAPNNRGSYNPIPPYNHTRAPYNPNRANRYPNPAQHNPTTLFGQQHQPRYGYDQQRYHQHYPHHQPHLTQPYMSYAEPHNAQALPTNPSSTNNFNQTPAAAVAPAAAAPAAAATPYAAAGPYQAPYQAQPQGPYQAPPQAPYQDLLGRLDSLYAQQPCTSREAGPDLHVLQPAQPHYAQTGQEQQQQQQRVGEHSDDSE